MPPVRSLRSAIGGGPEYPVCVGAGRRGRDASGGIKIGAIDDGTAIGMGLATAINNLKDSKAKSRIIVLLTDGRNNAGKIDPMTAAKLAVPLGIKVYTIGAGKPGATLYPVDTGSGTRYVTVKGEEPDEARS